MMSSSPKVRSECCLVGTLCAQLGELLQSRENEFIAPCYVPFVSGLGQLWVQLRQKWRRLIIVWAKVLKA
jgi:hypothetical protein